MSTLVLISGEEEFLVERAAKEEAALALVKEVVEYNFPDDSDKFYLESQTPSLVAEKRAYILWGVKEVPVSLPSGDDVVIVVSAKKPLKDKRATRSVNFPKLKAYSDNNEVLRWILKEGERFNIDLSRVAGALFVNSGNNLRKLSSEIEKLSLANPPGTIVSPENAKALICFSADLTPKEIIDAICDGQTIKALAFYDKLQERNDETGWIIAYMQRHVLQQLKIGLLIKKKASDDEIASAIELPVFIYRKIRSTTDKLWTIDSLQSSFKTLNELDLAHKRGDAFARFGLESELIRLSEEAKNVKH